MTYQRVLPRDLFNESKLLEQIGRICLAIHDNEIALNFEHDGEEFDINLTDCGKLYISNISFTNKEGECIAFTTNYNSRDKNPLCVTDPKTEDEFFVFDNIGKFSSSFLEMLNR